MVNSVQDSTYPQSFSPMEALFMPYRDLETQSRMTQWIVPLRSLKFASLIVAFVVLGTLVIVHATDAFDLAIVGFFHEIQSEQLDWPMIALTLTGDLSTVLIAGIFLSIIRRTRKLGLAILISMVAISILLMYIKPIFARPLPPYEFSPHVKLPDKFTLEQDVISFTHIPYSFPSGHETRAVALAFLVGSYLIRRHSRVGHLIWLYPGLVGIGRLYVFAHYPFDLFGSAILGIVIANIIARVLKLDRISSMADDRFVKERATRDGSL